MWEMQSWQSGVGTRGCRDVVTGVLQEWLCINLEFPGKSLPYAEGQGNSSAHLDPDCIFKSLDQKKKKKASATQNNQGKHPCFPDIQSLLSPISRTLGNQMKTITLMRHYYLRALWQQWHLKGIMDCQSCVISTHSGPVWTSYCLRFLPKLLALLGMVFQVHVSDTTSLFTFSSKTFYVFLCDSQIPLAL